MAYTPFTKDDQPTMQAFNEKFEQAIQQALADGVKIEVGSYVGTGTYGSANKNSLTFGFEPKFVYIAPQTPSINTNAFRPHVWFWVKGCGFMFNNASHGSSSDVELTYCAVTQADKTLAWYNSNGVQSQANKAGTYNYIAIG